jgi:hypothetical protein
MPLQQADLFVRQHDGLLAGVALEAQQPLVPRLDVMAQPHATNASCTDVHVVEAELVGHALRALRRIPQRVVEDRFSTSGATRFGCGLRGPRFCSTSVATPPTWKARFTS